MPASSMHVKPRRRHTEDGHAESADASDDQPIYQPQNRGFSDPILNDALRHLSEMPQPLYWAHADIRGFFRGFHRYRSKVAFRLLHDLSHSSGQFYATTLVERPTWTMNLNYEVTREFQDKRTPQSEAPKESPSMGQITIGVSLNSIQIQCSFWRTNYAL